MIAPIISDTEISLEGKVETLVTNYTSLLLTNEDLSFFVLNEMKYNKYVLNKVIKNTRILSQPIIENQLRERSFTISTPNFIMNIISLTMFPFLSKALLISTGLVKESGFQKFVIDRKQHIPTWVMKTLD